MRRRAGLALVATLGILPLLPVHAAAQVQVSIGGLVKSTVGLDTRRTTKSTGPTVVDRRLVWGSRYAPTADGFVWHRRFMQYSLSGTYADQTLDAARSRMELLHTEPYRVQLTFFPEATHTFTLRASRATFDTDSFAEGAPATRVTTTSESQGFNWGYRGGAVLPSGGLDFTRGTSTTEGPEGPSGQVLTTIGLHATKSFARANPTLRYRLDMRDDDRPLDPASEVSRIGHTFEYNDRIRIGERVFITPSATYQIDPITEGLRSVTTVAVPFAGPINPTLDGTAGFRYSLAQGEELLHTVAADGTLTKRVNPVLVVSGGLNGVVLRDDDSHAWAAGGFTNVDALPVPELRAGANYGLNFSSRETGTTVGHRGQLGLTSTHVPRHTLSANYFLNVIDAADAKQLFVSHSWRLGANSAALPRTILDAGYGLELQEGDGRQVAHEASVSATVTPPLPLALRGGVDFSRRTSSGGGRQAIEEMGWGVQAGADATPLDWLTFSLTGRRGVARVKREDAEGEFVTERYTAGVGVTRRAMQVRVDAFLDREPVVDRQGYGVRGSASYRFRIWTLTLDVEQAWFTSVGVQTEQQRVLFRLGRSLSHFFSWP